MRGMPPLVLAEEAAPHVRRLTLNRPQQLNAMTAELCAALHSELASIAAERSCRALILTGAGRGFCAGLDLHGYGAAPENDGSDDPRDRLANQQHMSRLVLALRAVPQPVIAAVNGPAAGFGLALEIPSEQAAVEYEDRQQIMATFGRAVPEAVEAFLDKRPAEFAD